MVVGEPRAVVPGMSPGEQGVLFEGTVAHDLGAEESRHPDAELIRRLRDVAVRLGDHGDALDEALSEIPTDTLVPALRHLVHVARRMGVEPRLSSELRAALDEMDAAQ